MSRAQLPAPNLPEPSGSPVGWIADIVRQGRLAWRLFWDSRVPFWTKLIPPAVLLYLFSPADFLPDVAIGLGQLDDLAIFLIGIKLFIELAPTEIVRQHLADLGARIQEWRVNDGKGEEAPQIVEGEFDAMEIEEGEEEEIVEAQETEEGEIAEVIEDEETESDKV
ncbi:MAG: DUF1232 domain-containing protein [Anaerolineae bacterium]|nr:DUF1232 domain-containing protein [Anaerolineae bacterium]